MSKTSVAQRTIAQPKSIKSWLSTLFNLFTRYIGLAYATKSGNQPDIFNSHSQPHRMMLRYFLTSIMALLFAFTGYSQKDTTVLNPVTSKWYDKIMIRGYMQVRYNRLLETNPKLTCEQCDRSWGKNGGFFIRRMRIIFFGQIHRNVYFYVQPDFASSTSSDRQHFAQIRDAYIDVGLDSDNAFRFRIGQSKVPYGFENMQSSQNRVPLDRHDAMNSAVSNERDLGVFFYWAPVDKRKLFSRLVSDGLKGSGDYGVFALGAFNGQTANNPELNDRPHIVSRITWPFTFGNQIVECSVQGYHGQFIISKANVSTGTLHKADLQYTDARAATSLVLYPQPFGIQAEYTIGRGPEFNPATDSIEVKRLHGGYVTLSYLRRHKEMVYVPFLRYQYYEGGKKHERDARSYHVNELEIGFEFQFNKYFELVCNYTFSERRYEDFLNQDNQQKGRLLRLQAQVNF